MNYRQTITFALTLILSSIAVNTLSAADLTRSEVQQLLKQASKANPANLRRKDLKGVDLSKLDFRNADLWGADLRAANLSQSNLSGLVLDLTVMVGINLSGADLSNVSIFGARSIRTTMSTLSASGAH